MVVGISEVEVQAQASAGKKGSLCGWISYSALGCCHHGKVRGRGLVYTSVKWLNGRFLPTSTTIKSSSILWRPYRYLLLAKHLGTHTKHGTANVPSPFSDHGTTYAGSADYDAK